jgi:hypothetical protein
MKAKVKDYSGSIFYRPFIKIEYALLCSIFVLLLVIILHAARAPLAERYQAHLDTCISMELFDMDTCADIAFYQVMQE